jgi:hypothetical protein
MHHDKLDDECRSEKYHLIRLLRKYKETIREIVNNKNLNCNVDVIKASVEYASLVKQFEATSKNIMDYDHFVANFGNDKDAI